VGPGVVLPLKWRARFNGQVRAVFDIVAPQPGNSYRVVAGGRQEDLERVLPRSADSDSEVFFDNDNNGCYNPQAYGGSSGGDMVLMWENYPIRNLAATRRLVVWRKLHVEVDSMGAVAGNTTANEATSIIPLGADAVAVILRDQVEKDRIENGTLIDQTGNRFTISSNTVTELIVDVADVTPQGPQITLMDDDQLQDGQDVPMPDTSELASAMWEAFVNVQFDVGDSNDNVPFVLNIGTIEEQLAAVDWDSKYDCSGSYWVTYVLGCFQPAIEWDNDGEREKVRNLAQLSR